MRRSWVAAVASWLVVVAIGSALVWAVISRVGDGLGATAGAPLTPSSVPSASAPSPSEPSTSGPSVPPASGPSSPTTPAGPEPQQATWQGRGGVVVAECTGAAIRQASVQPDPGYRVEVGNPGPEELEVEFEGREDQEGSHSHVRAVCVAGAPRFSVETED